MDTDCFGGGKYCAVESTNQNQKGREIILEDLRQICLYESMQARNATINWWKYISRVHYTCGSVINEACSERAHEFLKLDFKET